MCWCRAFITFEINQASFLLSQLSSCVFRLHYYFVYTSENICAQNERKSISECRSASLKKALSLMVCVAAGRKETEVLEVWHWNTDGEMRRQ